MGTNYHGWQIQKNAISIQKVFQDALLKVVKHSFELKACSRTDAGVHANAFCVSVKIGNFLSPQSLILALNRFLPHDIRVIDCMRVDDNFHARYSCISKEYVYKVYNNRVMDPFMFNRSLHFWYPLDLELINSCCDVLVGRHDFSAFCSSDERIRGDMFRNIICLRVSKNNNIVEFKIQADGFLYNMVRIIVGTLLEVNHRKMSVIDIKNILDSKDRSRAGDTLPACGLYLNRIFYEGLVI